MGKTKAPRTLIVALLAILLLGAAQLIQSCYSLERDETASERRMTLESGMDKKSVAVGGEVNLTPPSGAEYGGGRSYDAEYREKTRSPAAAGVERFSAAEEPGYPGESRRQPSMISQVLAQAGIDEAKLDSWFLPKAYAQDHQIDERYLVRTGQCDIDVEDYQAAVDQITAIAERYGGLISDSHAERMAENWIEGWLTLRVPAEKFFEVWSEVLKVGDVMSQSTSSEDVGQQYTGYISRLKRLTAEQAKLEEMLDEALAVQRSRGLGEGYTMLLDLQKRLFDVTEEIQATEDRANALADQITRSTITARLKEKKELAAQVQQVKEEWSWGFGTTAAQAYQDLLVKLRAIGKGFVYFIITCWTWVIPWALIIWLGIWIYRRWVRPRFKALYAAAPAGDATLGEREDRPQS